jgi:hypothetical protein
MEDFLDKYKNDLRAEVERIKLENELYKKVLKEKVLLDSNHGSGLNSPQSEESVVTAIYVGDELKPTVTVTSAPSTPVDQLPPTLTIDTNLDFQSQTVLPNNPSTPLTPMNLNKNFKV